jgi:hypothetical protein
MSPLFSSAHARLKCATKSPSLMSTVSVVN